MHISTEHLKEWENMPTRAERDFVVEQTVAISRYFPLHINPYSLRGWRLRAKNANLYCGANPADREQLLEDLDADSDGYFTFPPRKLYLAYTAESVTVPTNETWRFRSYFVLKDGGKVTPLTTNLTAPSIHPGSRGPQTYEILNESNQTVTVCMPNLVCIVAVIPLSGHVQRRPETFAIQEGQRPRLGNPTRW